MLYPALVMKLIQFKNKNNETSFVPAEGFNIIQAQLDTGEIIDIDIFSNDKEMNSLFQYLDNKGSQGVKENKAKSLALDLVFNPDNQYAERIKKIEDYLLSKGTPQSKVKQEASMLFVKKLLKENSTIKSTSIFRMALAEGNGKYNSRSIYVKNNDKGEKIYSTSGIYNHAQLENQIPIELSYIYNSENQPIGFVKVVTSDLINSNQINFILNHVIRTIEKSINESSKAFMPTFVFTSGISNELKNLYTQFNNISQLNRKSETVLDINQYTLSINILKSMLNHFYQNRSDYKYFKMELPMLIKNEKFANGLKTVGEHGKSPFQVLREALINLNFSKENPEVKKMLKDKLLNLFFMPIINAQYNPKMLSVYNIPAANLLGESDSWGFMVDNVDFSKLTLGKKEIENMYNFCKAEVENVNNE